LDHALQAIIDKATLDAPWDLVTAFSAFPRWKPEDVNKAAEMIVQRLETHGVPVTVHEAKMYLSIPYEASVSIADRTMRAKPPSYSASIPEGLTAPLVYVRASYAKSINSLFGSNSVDLKPDVAGKIALTEGYGLPQKIAELQEAGAVAVITINPGVDIHWAICTPIWGTPGLGDLARKPRIPVLSVNRQDGDELIQLAAGNEPVTVRTLLDEGWFTQKIPVVEIRGDSPDFVLLHGHYDSWDVGVGDNATGDATLLEVARVLWNERTTLKRSVRVAWWPGHSTGRYAGSTWYADAFALELNDHCVAQINCDSPGCRWATEYRDLAWTPETVAFAQSVIKEVTGLDSSGGRPPRAGDWSFNNIGLSGFFMLSSTMPEALCEEKHYYAVGGCGGNIAWHTENDLLEIADRDILLRDIRVYLASVWLLSTAEILPFDWREAAATLRRTLDEYQRAIGDAFSLAPAARALTGLSDSLDCFYAAMDGGALPAETSNTVIRSLARILVYVDHSADARFLHDPALSRTSLPALALAKTYAALPDKLSHFALVEIARGQNRVVEAFSSAAKLVQMNVAAVQAADKSAVYAQL
jgi:hypothetical protein